MIGKRLTMRGWAFVEGGRAEDERMRMNAVEDG
jgi:hypothetical protein